VPSLADSLRILRAYSRIDPVDAPTDAGEIVEFCGRLPIALRSAGEHARGRGTMSGAAAYLRPPHSRLERLAHSGRNVEGRFGAEYDRLLPHEQQAFRFLALVSAEHTNLVRTVHAAHNAAEWGIAWRVGARLGGCLPQTQTSSRVSWRSTGR
jgi:hypothetical protein